MKHEPKLSFSLGAKSPMPHHHTVRDTLRLCSSFVEVPGEDCVSSTRDDDILRLHGHISKVIRDLAQIKSSCFITLIQSAA